MQISPAPLRYRRQAVCIGWSQFIAVHCSATILTAIICLLLTGCSTMQIRYVLRSHSSLPGGGKMKPVRRSRFREPSSRRQSRAMIIGIALMPPANDPLMMLGIAFCALESH